MLDSFNPPPPKVRPTVTDGDRVSLDHAAKTMLEPGRPRRTVPAGTTGVIERHGPTLIRIQLDEPNPVDGLHDIVVSAPALVTKIS